MPNAHKLKLGISPRFPIRPQNTRQQPFYTATCVAILALGIGANSALFSVVHSVILKRLPYRNPEEFALHVHPAQHFRGRFVE